MCLRYSTNPGRFTKKCSYLTFSITSVSRQCFSLFFLLLFHNICKLVLSPPPTQANRIVIFVRIFRSQKRPTIRPIVCQSGEKPSPKSVCVVTWPVKHASFVRGGDPLLRGRLRPNPVPGRWRPQGQTGNCGHSLAAQLILEMAIMILLSFVGESPSVAAFAGRNREARQSVQGQ